MPRTAARRTGSSCDRPASPCVPAGCDLSSLPGVSVAGSRRRKPSRSEVQPMFRFHHIHLRSPDPEATADYYQRMFGAEITRSTYPAASQYAGKPKLAMNLGGQRILIAPAHPSKPNGAPRGAVFRHRAYRPHGGRHRRGGRTSSKRRVRSWHRSRPRPQRATATPSSARRRAFSWKSSSSARDATSPAEAIGAGKREAMLFDDHVHCDV